MRNHNNEDEQDYGGDPLKPLTGVMYGEHDDDDCLLRVSRSGEDDNERLLPGMSSREDNRENHDGKCTPPTSES